MKRKHILLPFALLALTLWMLPRSQQYHHERLDGGSFKLQLFGEINAQPEDFYMVQDTIYDYVAQFLAFEEIRFGGEWELKLLPGEKGTQTFVLNADLNWDTASPTLKWISATSALKGLDFQLDTADFDPAELRSQVDSGKFLPSGRITGCITHPDAPDKVFELNKVRFRLKIIA